MSNPYLLSCKANLLKAKQGDKLSRYWLIHEWFGFINGKCDQFPEDAKQFVESTFYAATDDIVFGKNKLKSFFPDDNGSGTQYFRKHHMYQDVKRLYQQYKEQGVKDAYRTATNEIAKKYFTTGSNVRKHITELNQHFKDVFSD